MGRDGGIPPGPRGDIAGAMPRYATRSKRALRQNLVRAAIWVFLVLFIGSVVGVAIVTVRPH